ncbi:acetylxylan esterase [Thermogutta sp.]|uniref:acetylxylan esterase n=1 Tax=Thermogutta sp. TaxID=1962930 RepID=UPI003C7C81E1
MTHAGRGGRRLFAPAVAGAFVLAVLSGANLRAEKIGPWDTDVLFQPPRVEWSEEKDGVRELYYQGEPYQGRPTRVYAVYAQPPGAGPFPAMVCVHGGGGTAFQEWVRLWAERGYAAISMDLAGCGPHHQRLPDGGPDQSDESKFRSFDEDSVTDMWTYHAVAAVIRAHSLLRSLPQIDAQRIGVTGISWGGYLTCIVAGVDNRFRLAIPVYGCGFLHENSVWLPRFEKMPPEQRERWIQFFDPSQYLGRVRCPIFFLNGTNDFAYPLDSYRKSYDLVPGEKFIRIEVRMKHSHPDGWAPPEIGLFADSLLKGGQPLPRLSPLHRENQTVWCEVTSALPLKQAHLNYTIDGGRWQDRQWTSIPAKLERDCVVAELPPEQLTAYYVDVVDERGAMISTPPEIVR